MSTTCTNENIALIDGIFLFVFPCGNTEGGAIQKSDNLSRIKL